MVRLFATLLTAAFLVPGQALRAASPSPKPAFYFWRTRWSPSPSLLAALTRNDVGRLYVRFFDVEWDAPSRAARPVAPISFAAAVPPDVDVVPVVYLTNAVFLHETKPEDLADRVWRKVERLSKDGAIRLRELQIDCDWSDLSRGRYFRFASALRSKAEDRGLALSATIRLHQVKYSKRVGVPPVDRGMLMFYNVGRLDAAAERPSIFNASDAGKYAAFVADYPLPLDLALPIFSWLVHARDGRVIGLTNDADVAAIESSGAFERASPTTYRAKRSLLLRGRYYRTDDTLRLEDTGPERTRLAAALAARGAGEKTFGAVAFFDLDEQRIKRYAPTDFLAIARTFR